MRTLLSFILLYLYLSTNSPLVGQQIRSLWFHSLSKQEGLSSNTIQHFFTDSQGRVWIASLAGLNSFDGHVVRSHPLYQSDSLELVDNFISGKFFEDSETNLWFCTNSAIYCYRRKQDRFSRHYLLDENQQPIKDNYQAVALERDTFLWVRAANNDLFTFNIKNERNSAAITRIEFDVDIIPVFYPDGHLKRMYSLNSILSPGIEILEFGPSGEFLDTKTVFAGGGEAGDSILYVNDLFLRNDTSIWFTTHLGVKKWNPATNKLTEFPLGVKSPKTIAEVDDRYFLVTEEQGYLYLFDYIEESYSSVRVRLIENPGKNSPPLIGRGYVDREGNYWLPIKGEGLLYGNPHKVKMNFIPKHPIPRYSKLKDSTISYNYRTIVQDQEGHIWISTFVDGLVRMDTSRQLIEHFHPNNKQGGLLPDNQINHLICDRNNNLWAGTQNNLLAFSRQQNAFKPIFDEKNRSVPYAVYILELKSGALLVSTLQRGIFILRSDERGWYLKQLKAPEDPSDYFTSMYEDQLGNIYVARRYTQVETFRLRGDSLVYHNSIPISGLVNGFAESPEEGVLWIATNAGLAEFPINSTNKVPKYYSESEGFMAKSIQSVLKYDKETLFFGTSTGIVKMNITDRAFEHYSLADGMASLQFDDYAILKEKGGKIWLGGNHGITIINPQELENTTRRNTIVINKIKVNDEDPIELIDANSGTVNVNQIQSLQFPYSENTLSFEFAGIDYSNPQEVQLEYFLEGWDKSWVTLEPGKVGFARYSNLASGTYNFKIRIKGQTSNTEAAPRSLEIKIKTPFWRSAWFLITCAAILFLALYFSIRLRIRRIQAKEQLNTRYAESKLTALISQMNPHFIFNSLHSINSYILERDVAKASRYLTKFAQLMRMTFDLSKFSFIRIEKEIEILKKYLEVEALRFKTPFQYEIIVDEHIDQFETEIPTMLLQPFVENAIWHGLANKEGGKRLLQIKLDLCGKSIECSIKDNGIGRVKAAELRKQQGRNHKPGAILNIKERLAILEALKNEIYSVEIIDLTSTEGETEGTLVKISFPLD